MIRGGIVMIALVWTGTEQLELQERPVPDYTGKVLIKVGYAGICGTDVSVYLGKHPRAKTPLVIGHEFSGTIEAIDDPAAGELKPGDRVIVNPLYFCGTCRACLKGNTHVCRSLRLYGTDSDGGMAQYAVVPAKNLYRMPEGMDLSLAAVVEPVAVVVHGLRMMKFLKLKDAGFTPAYTRTDFTDKLHETFGFRTDYEILSKASMRKIISQSKKR